MLESAPLAASDQRRGVRAAVCGQLPRRLSAHVAAIAAYQEQRARADRERLVCRTTADRLRRRNADPRLQRYPRLLSEQAGSDHVHDRSRGFARGTVSRSPAFTPRLTWIR